MSDLTNITLRTTDPLLTGGVVAGASKSDKVEEAARQFEGFLIAQMLQSVRESNSLGFEDDSGTAGSSQTSTMFDIADQQFAQMLSRQGGFGLARMAAQNLTKSS